MAHEALLRRWPTLADLLAEDRDALLLLDGVLSAAADWDKAEAVAQAGFSRPSRIAPGRRAGARGARPGLGARDCAGAAAYLAACQAREAAEREEREAALAREQARVARAKKLQRRVGWALATIAVLVVIGLTGVYWQHAANIELQASLGAQQRQLGQARADLATAQAENERRQAQLDLAQADLAIEQAEHKRRQAQLDHAQADLAAEQAETKRRQAQLDHAQVNLLAELATVEKLRGNWDSALRLGVRAARLELLRDRDAVTASREPCGNGRTTGVAHGPERTRRQCEFRRLQPRRHAHRHGVGDKTARIWDAATGKEITVLRGHENWCEFRRLQPRRRTHRHGVSGQDRAHLGRRHRQGNHGPARAR